MSEEALRCANCSKETNLTRRLDCGHEFCDFCCKTNCRSAWTMEHVVCPLDDHVTNMPLGYENSLKTLPKRIALNLPCENCCKISSVQNHWWCDECNETVCSFCAMKHHRNHNCNVFDFEKLITECVSYVKPLSVQATDVDYEWEIEKFCLSLSEELKTRFALLQEATNFVAAVMNVCNAATVAVAATPSSSIAATPSDKTSANIRKKFNLAFAVLSKFDTKIHYDVEKLKILLQATKAPSGEFPNVESVADLFFECMLPDSFDATVEEIVTPPSGGGGGEISPQPPPGLTKNGVASPSVAVATVAVQSPRKPSSSSNGIDDETVSKEISLPNYPKPNFSPTSLDAPNGTKSAIFSSPPSSFAEAIQKPKQVAPAKAEYLKWSWYVTLKFTEPSTLCAVPNLGVAVLDRFGIHMLDQKLNYVQYKGWPCPASSNVSVQTPGIVYHPTRASLLVVREVNNNNHAEAKKIIEFSVPGLSRQRVISYPKFADADRRLLAVLTNGHVLCAGSSAIWKIDFSSTKPPVGGKFEIVWSRTAACKLEPFQDMLVGPRLDSDRDALYISARQNVYIFAVTQATTVQIVRVVSGVCSSLIFLRNSVFALNKDQSALIVLSPGGATGRQQQNDKIAVQALDSSQDFVAISSSGSSVYLLKRNNSVYVGAVGQK